MMHDLIRQEDERGDRSREKKLTHRMRRLTLSSSKVFTQKYATLIRRIEPKIPENATQSLSSIFGGSATTPSSFRRRRKSRLPSIKSSAPFIVRSISNDTGVRPGHVSVKSFLTVPGLSDYQENTRSAPDLPVDEFQAKTRLASNYSTDSEESLQLDLEIAPPDSNVDESQEEEDNLQDNWIKPGETRSCENSQQDLGPRHHNLLEDLKSFSRRLQKLMHIKPKEIDLAAKPKHPFVPSLERKAYYSSQPELPTCSEDVPGPNLSSSSSMLQLNSLPSYARTMQRSASLNHLVAPESLAPPAPPNTLLLKAPELRICPSTPTPTRSELVTFDCSNFTPSLAQLDHSVYISNSTNHSNQNNESSLLAPFAIRQQPPRESRSSTELQQQQQPGAATGPSSIPTTVEGSSPSLKRFASPAGSNRLKLTPSPSKSGISAATNADSASTSTASTATTMVPTTVGEICRRSSDSDLSVTPKGM